MLTRQTIVMTKQNFPNLFKKLIFYLQPCVNLNCFDSFNKSFKDFRPMAIVKPQRQQSNEANIIRKILQRVLEGHT